jgi:hypothetical protein
MRGGSVKHFRWGVALLVAAALPAALLTSCTPPPKQIFGMHDDLTWDSDNSRIASTYDYEQAFGSKISRNTLRWNVVQSSPTSFNWSKPDYVVKQATQRGIAVDFVVRDAPAWANSSTDPKVVPSGATAFNTFVNRYKAFFTKAVQRYGDRVKYWEVWSEPNENHYWQPSGLNPVHDQKRWIDMYAQLFNATRAAVQSVNTSVKVSVGAITGLGASCCILGTDFVKGLISRNVTFPYLAINPHSGQNQPPWQCIQFQQSFCDIAKIRTILVNAKRSGTELWATEFGWQVGAYTNTGTTRSRLRVPGDRNRLNLWPASGKVTLWDGKSQTSRTVSYSSITRTDNGYSDINLTKALLATPANGTQLSSAVAEQNQATYVRAALQMLKGTYQPASGRPQQNYSYVRIGIYFDNVDKTVTYWGMYGLLHTAIPNYNDPGHWILQPKPAAGAFHDVVG